eukprot:COSAG01_NODE_608_length_14865_cov_5.517879_13_plen_863_part_00
MSIVAFAHLALLTWAAQAPPSTSVPAGGVTPTRMRRATQQQQQQKGSLSVPLGLTITPAGYRYFVSLTLGGSGLGGTGGAVERAEISTTSDELSVAEPGPASALPLPCTDVRCIRRCVRSTRIAPCVHNVSRNVGPVYQDTIALGYTMNTGRGAAGGMLRTRGVFTVVTTHHESGHWQPTLGLGRGSSVLRGFVVAAARITAARAPAYDHGGQFALCLDPGPSAFGDDDGGGNTLGHSSLDFGGPDPHKYHGTLSRMVLLGGGKREQRRGGSYLVEGPLRITVDHVRVNASERLPPPPPPHGASGGDVKCHDVASMAVGECSGYKARGFCSWSSMKTLCPYTCGVCHAAPPAATKPARQYHPFGIDAFRIDANVDVAVSLPAAALAAVGRAVLQWFAHRGGRMVHGGEQALPRRRPCGASDHRQEVVAERSTGVSCLRRRRAGQCGVGSVAALCPASCKLCMGESGVGCTTHHDCGAGYFCHANTSSSAIGTASGAGRCEQCRSTRYGMGCRSLFAGRASSCLRVCEAHQSVAAVLAKQLFGPSAAVCAPAPATHYTAAVDFSTEFPTISMWLPGASAGGNHSTAGQVEIRLPPAAYLRISGAARVCRALVALPPPSHGNHAASATVVGTLGLGMLRQYYTLFDTQRQQLGLAPRAQCGRGAGASKQVRGVGSSSVNALCAARVVGGCEACVGAIDDAEPSRGYCAWCPLKDQCVAADPRSVEPPCPFARGWAQPALDAAPGGSCRHIGALAAHCQQLYVELLQHAVVAAASSSSRAHAGHRCSGSPLQGHLDELHRHCNATEVLVHVGADVVRLPRAGVCVPALMRASPALAPAMRGCRVPVRSPCLLSIACRCECGRARP